MPPGIQVLGLKEFRAELHRMDGNWDSALSLAHQKIASKGAILSRARAAGMGGVQAKAKSAIGEKHSVREAQVGVFASALDRMGPVAFWGAKRHTGWYAAGRYSRSPAQHPKWVGNAWAPLVAGQGPYAINDALAAAKNQLLDEYLEMIDRIAKDAFPER
jgi:hypothetical protein